MNEDAKLNAFLKERLESGIPGDPPRLDAILHAASLSARRPHALLWRRLLTAASLAACLAALCLLSVHLRHSPQPAPQLAASPAGSLPAPEQAVVDAIDLLSMADGEDLDVEDGSVEDVLLAWQDAPYRDAVSGLFAETETSR